MKSINAEKELTHAKTDAMFGSFVTLHGMATGNLFKDILCRLSTEGSLCMKLGWRMVSTSRCSEKKAFAAASVNRNVATAAGRWKNVRCRARGGRLEMGQERGLEFISSEWEAIGK